MFTVPDCIIDRHDLRLVLFALALCIVASATGLLVYGRARSENGQHRIGWSAFAGLITACGVWTTHLLCMLALQPGFSLDFAMGWTALSLAAAVVILGCGFFLAARGDGTGERLFGGGVLGAGIIATHFIGVGALRGATIVGWHAGLLGAGAAAALLLGAATLAVLGEARSPLQRATAVGLLVAAIFGMHFTSMAAITLAPSPTAYVASSPPVAAAIGGVTGLLLMASISMLAMSGVSARAAIDGMRSALDELPEAIAWFDRDQRLIFHNRKYAEIFASCGDEPLKGLRCDMLLKAAAARGDAGAPCRKVCKSAAAGSCAWSSVPDEFELPDGRIVQIRVGPARDGATIAVLVDMTLARQAERLAVEARERAEAASRSKSDFLANMSHEIRTPLNGVLGMGQLMAAGPLAPEQRERLEVIMASGQSLLALLNDLLDLAKIEAGQLELENASFDIESTLRPVWDTFSAAARQKGVAFEATVMPNAVGGWRGDPLRLRQLVTNLVSNAVKFTSRGSVTVLVDAADGDLRIAIHDTGIGIKAAQLPTLFDKFTQADSSTTRMFGGSGLGLAICHDITTLMGGSLTVDSAEGRGSTFTFRAPLERSAEPLPPAIEEPAACDDRRLRILAAEDNPTNQLVLRSILEPLDVELVMAGDGEAAVQAFSAGEFDVVLMDIQMPKLGGVEATRAIREMETRRGTGRTPVIALTANVMKHQLGAYYAAGMDSVVSKPIRISDLISAIQGALPLEQAA
jgi:signal transduction histidine kinase/NO-binding membrane sensor protein with MHYT domain